MEGGGLEYGEGSGDINFYEFQHTKKVCVQKMVPQDLG
jgi:hypothetical protein